MTLSLLVNPNFQSCRPGQLDAPTLDVPGTLPPEELPVFSLLENLLEPSTPSCRRLTLGSHKLTLRVGLYWSRVLWGPGPQLAYSLWKGSEEQNPDE